MPYNSKARPSDKSAARNWIRRLREADYRDARDQADRDKIKGALASGGKRGFAPTQQET